MSTINFSHLRLLAVYATVVEAKSFAAAARSLHTSRSRVSEQVSQLEQALGVRLLQRSTRKLLMTSEGTTVYEQARALPELLDSIEGIVQPVIPHGRVVITMNHDIAHKFVLPILQSFQSEFPEIQLDLALDDEVTDMIADRIDLGIRIGMPKDSSLIGRVMHEESFSIYASPAYLKKNGIPKSSAQLEHHQWILLPQLEYENVLRFHKKKALVEVRPTQYYRCNSPLMIQRMVEEGLGLGALLPCTVQQEEKKGKLVRVLPTLTTDPLVFSLVYPSRKNLPQRTKIVIDFLLATQLFSSN